jgi:hypothetical protein
VEVNVVVDDVASRDEPDLLKVRASVYVGVADLDGGHRWSSIWRRHE